MTALGDYLKKTLEERKLSQREASRLTGVGHTHIRSMILGVDSSSGKPFDPSPAILRKLSTGLGLSYIRLLDLAGYLPEGIPADVLEVLSEPKYRPLVEAMQSNPDALAALIRVVKDIIQNP